VVNNAIFGLLFFFLLNLIPGILGQLPETTYFIKIPIILLLILNLLFNKIKWNKTNLLYLASVGLIILLFISHSFFYDKQIIVGVINNSIFIFISASMVLFFEADPNKLVVAKKIILIYTLVFSVSYFISYTSILLGSSLGTTDIYLPMGKDKFYRLTIMYPFSTFYQWNLPSHLIFGYFPRATGFVREPGIFQVVIIFSYFITLEIVKKKITRNILLLVLLITLLLTFSTAGYLGILATMFIYYLFNIKYKRKLVIIFVVISIGISFAFFYQTENIFGLQEKLDSGSGLTRIFAIEQSIYFLKKYPIWGIGMYSSKAELLTIGVNFLGVLAQIGLIGLVITLFPFVYIIKINFKNKINIVYLTPILLTFLFAQPLHDKPLTYLVLGMLIVKNKFK